MTEVDSDEDLTKELQPLAYHVSDRRRVLREALKALKGKRLDAMIPPALNNWDRSRLEFACVETLEDVDDETLLAILDGRVGTAGVAAVEQPTSPIKVAAVKAKKKLKQKKLLAKNVAEETDVVEDEPKKKKKKKAVVEQVNEKNEEKIAKLKKKKKLLKAKAKLKVKKKKKAAAAAEAEEPSAPAPHKSLMELLELEYRAKAIKALLRSQGQTVPDIPLNIDEDSNDTMNINQVEQKTQKVKLPSEVNGNSECVSNTLVETATSQESKIKTFSKKETTSSTKIAKSSVKPKERKSSELVVPGKVAVGQKEAVEPKKNVANSPPKPPLEQKPKKAVIDLIDEALNTNFSEEPEVTAVSNNDAIEPPSVIAEACAQKNIDSEALRNKLLQKYQKQKQRKIKKKKKPEPDLKDQGDILDLHPQELSLTDEEQTVEQNTASCTDNDTSEYSDSEPEESNPDNSLRAETSPVQKKEVAVKLAEEEELNYDEDSLDDDIVTSIDKNQTDDVSQSEIMEVDNTQDSNSVSQAEQSIDKKSDDPEFLQKSDSDNNTRDEPLSENSRSGMFSETTRDDVFEGASAGNSAFAQSLKRKITFRIDPARIGVLEEQGAEEEARKAEERKLEDNENEELEEVKEVEEGEIDSNEEAEIVNEKLKSPDHSSPKGNKKKDLRDFLNRRHNKSVNSDVDTDESQDSISYNTKRSSYNRKTSHTERDFVGTYSPNRTVDKPEKNDQAPKRPSSPVEFITQFSDMEPISDDSDHSDSKTSRVESKKKSAAIKLPVQGCAEKPSVQSNKIAATDISSKVEKDLIQAQSSTVNLENNEDSQTSVASDTASKSSVAEKADSESGEDEDDDELPKPITWYERWAQSHGMQKVAKTNKIHKKVRTKLKQVTSAKKKPIELPKEEPSIEAEPIIGSIEEYEKLFGKKVVNSEVEPTPGQYVNMDPDKSELDSSMHVDNNDDDDADDLWGDILGGS